MKKLIQFAKNWKNKRRKMREVEHLKKTVQQILASFTRTPVPAPAGKRSK